MIIREILNTKIPFSLALLAIMAMGANTEQLFLQGAKLSNQADNVVATINWAPPRTSLDPWLRNIKETVALSNATIPLIPGAKRITFNNNQVVRYRVAAPANLAASFYHKILAGQGWQANLVATAADKLTIAFVENSLSHKTDITYTYSPLKAVSVLGVKIAEADLSAPASTNELPPPPDQQSLGSQTQPSATISPESQPSQTISDNQTPPLDQPVIKEMQFVRPPTEINPNDQGTNQINRGDQPGEPRQLGPSAEDQNKMDERRFKDMKRGLAQFASGAKMMKRSLAKIKTANSKCGVGLPEELVNALAQTDNLVEKINQAKTADELDEIVEDIQDVGSVMQDWGPRLGDLSRLCQMLKRAERDAKQFERSIKRIESQAKANKKIDLSELIAEYKTSVNAQKDVLTQAKELAKTDPDSALEKIEDDFYGNLDNLGNLQMQIDTIFNINRGLKDISRELNSLASRIKILAKKKVDTANLQAMLNNFKTQVEEIKSLIKGKVDPEELIDKVDEAFSARQNLQDALQELDIINTVPQLNAGTSFNVKMNLPDAFRKTEANNDKADQVIEE